MNTKSSQSNSSKKSPITINSPLPLLFKRASKNADALHEAGIKKVLDLLWILPLRIEKIPPPMSFSEIKEGFTFCGEGKIINVRGAPNFRARGRKGALLYNVTVIIKDNQSEQTLILRWFNTYPSLLKKIKEIGPIRFHGTPTFYADQLQITNPHYQELLGTTNLPLGLEITYPQINNISGTAIKEIIERVPNETWDQLEESISPDVILKRDLLDLKNALKTIHAKIPAELFSNDNLEKAKLRLIYEEFFTDQAKIFLRRSMIKQIPAQIIKSSPKEIADILKFFPFEFTEDQKKSISEIASDLSSGNPMMRLIQGDVGSGKTAVAIVASIMALKNGQVALMCPTESLALQHFHGQTKLLENLGIKSALLIGSTPQVEKKSIYEKIKKGEISFLIGTHALIQEAIEFKNLILAIIDEQHKFGVNQRLKLASKNEGVHTLIMTATPIPRSLSLTQFGDLDISIIKQMPAGRKGIKTKIVTPENLSSFLSFVKTRIAMKEQVYVVTPAILENEQNDFMALEEVYKKFLQIFKEERILPLHGKMKPAEKEQNLFQFATGKIDMLISTSVVEVGINVPNATIMAIINPERFGLSSLHQLRGRVGRGEKPGFCFLVTDRQIGVESMERLKVIEETTDGFKIAEEDLRIRGEGDLFGTAQAGAIVARRLSNIVDHQKELQNAREDLIELIEKNDRKTLELMDRLTKDLRVTLTV